jgi:hypothetical protein
MLQENVLPEVASQQQKLQEQQDLQDKLQRIAQMRMFDDTLMNAVFDSRIAETEVLIQIILGRDDIKVTSTKTQEEFINVYGKMVTLDIVARDADNKLYNIEVQRDKYKAPPQRARFHAAVMDITLLKDRQPFKEMPERYTIFITEEDKFGSGFPMYHVENVIKELRDEPFPAGYRPGFPAIGQHQFGSCADEDENALSYRGRAAVHVDNADCKAQTQAGTRAALASDDGKARLAYPAAGCGQR